MKTMKALYLKYKFLFFVVFISLISVFNLTNFGISPTHDAEYHILRFWQFYKVLSDGVLFPRWAPDFNNGFGVPLFTYVYPLPNYVASLFHFLGFGFIDSFKISMVAATLFGATFFYLWSKRFWGEWGALVCAIFYSFSPYRLVDIYVRGSIGEVWAIAIFPGLLWSYTNFIDRKERKFFVTSIIFLALIIYAHNILALMFFGFFLAYAAIVPRGGYKRLEDVKRLTLIIFLGLGFAAPFWLPALLERSFVQGLAVFDLTQNFVPFYKFFVPIWGFGLSPNDVANPMSVQLGYANIIGLILSLSLLADQNKRIIWFFLISFLVVFFLMTPYSVWFWKNIPLISYFQFPWRLLSLEILITSFLAGAIVRKKALTAIVLILISIGFSLHYIKAPYYFPRTDQHYLERSNFTDGTNSPGNVFNTTWLGKVPNKQKNKIEFIEGSGRINTEEIKSNSYVFIINSNIYSKIRINTAYFPGWTAKVDGKLQKITNNQGIMELNIPTGVHVIRIKLESTFVQKLSYIYFLTSMLCLCFLDPIVKFKNKDIRSTFD